MRREVSERDKAFSSLKHEFDKIASSKVTRRGSESMHGHYYTSKNEIQ